MAYIKLLSTVVVPKVVVIACAVINAANDLDLPDMVITSGHDSKHKMGSLHYQDKALDFRTKHLMAGDAIELRRKVQTRLGSDYDVLLEDAGGPNEHLHVEFDPK